MSLCGMWYVALLKPEDFIINIILSKDIVLTNDLTRDVTRDITGGSNLGVGEETGR